MRKKVKPKIEIRKASPAEKVKVLKELRKHYTEKELYDAGVIKTRTIKNITEENLRWMIKHWKVDERIYE